MSDEEIVELFFRRDESAIGETDKKNGAYCRTIANHILRNPQELSSIIRDFVELAHPNSPSAWQNILFWHGLCSECADLLSSYDKHTKPRPGQDSENKKRLGEKKVGNCNEN